MYVKKFESETLNDALKEIKNDLGPDAIILKTVTNKGIKGAFKKKKIEITAAISEKNYRKKAKIDSVLDDDQREKFYSEKSGHIAHMIDNHDAFQEQQEEKNVKEAYQDQESYGKIGINRTVKKVEQKNLEDFLNGAITTKESIKPKKKEGLFDKEDSGEYFKKICELENKIVGLEKKIESITNNDPYNLFELRTTLRSLEIDEKCIQEVIKKVLSQFSRKEIQNTEGLYEFVLQEMLSKINTSIADVGSSSSVTLFLSESQCGQSCTIKKMAALKEGSVIISKNKSHEKDFAKEIYGIKSLNASSFSDIVTFTKEYFEKERPVFIDYKNSNKEIYDIKKVIKALSKAFDNVKVLLCISSIHSEIYNKRILSRYNQLSDGIIVTNLDLCLNYGSVFNIAYNFRNTPLKFFGTGDVIPDDIEAATGERIIAGLFQLD